MNVEDRRSAATRHLGRTWTREEEWYNFRTNPRGSVHVLLSVDESTYDPRGYSVPGGSPPMGDHPSRGASPMTEAARSTRHSATAASTGTSRTCSGTCSAESAWPPACSRFDCGQED